MARAVRAALQPARAAQHLPGGVLCARGEPELRVALPPPRRARAHRAAGLQQLLPPPDAHRPLSGRRAGRRAALPERGGRVARRRRARPARAGGRRHDVLSAHEATWIGERLRTVQHLRVDVAGRGGRVVPRSAADRRARRSAGVPQLRRLDGAARVVRAHRSRRGRERAVERRRSQRGAAPGGGMPGGGRMSATLAADNDALVQLAGACPMRGDLTMCVDRAPDFFGLVRLEGERWRVGVADLDGSVVGCVAASERPAYLNGSVTRTAYVGDLKVHPAHRNGLAADALEEFAREACRGYGGDDVLALITVLGGNRAMERRVAGPRGLPTLTRFATLHVHAIPLLWPRPETVSGLRVDAAREEDLDEMGALWSRVAPDRQLAPVLGPARLRAWIDGAPGLAIEDYLAARRSDGRIAGFLALWDQYYIKQLRVLGYSTRLAVARGALNAMAPLAGTPRLPAAGNVLPSLAALHCCVPGDEPAVLRALLLRAYAARRGSGYLFLTLALDQRDPLRVALRGLLAQPTVVGAYATTPAGRWTGPALDGRPLHYESALV